MPPSSGPPPGRLREPRPRRPPPSRSTPIRGRGRLDVDLDDDAHRGDGERDVRAIARCLPGVGIERERSRMTVDALDVDLSPTRRSRSSRAARHASRTAPAAIQVIREQRKPSLREPTGRHAGAPGESHPCLARAVPLRGSTRNSLADLGRRAVHLRAPVGEAAPAPSNKSSKPLRVAECLEAHGEPTAPQHPRRVARVTGATGRRSLRRGPRLRHAGAPRGG